MSSRKKILFLCDASDIDVVEDSFSQDSDYQLTIETTEKVLSFGVKAYISQTVERINHNPGLYDGVVGTHDSSSLFAAIIAQETGKRFAPVSGIINSQNKYLCRRVQKKVAPEAAPRYCLALDYLRDPSRLSTPFFIKPVRSNISFGTHKVNTPEELHYYIGLESMDIALFNQYYLDALSYNSGYYDALNIATCNTFLCEDLIEGEQVTVDGYVMDGEVSFFGVTKAVYHPLTNSFSHHEFPCELPEEMLGKISDALGRLIPALEMDDSFFNVELRLDMENHTFKIIEVNSRIAFQFAKTIEAVSGYDPLRMLCDLAVGEKPKQYARAENTSSACYNFELHAFEDARILETPTQSAYDEIRLKYPGVRVRNLIHENVNLSDFKHNPQSYRYCLLDIPGENREEIMRKYEDIIARLRYKFAPASEESQNVVEHPGQPPQRTKGGAEAFDSQVPPHPDIS